MFSSKPSFLNLMTLDICVTNGLKKQVTDLWDKLPIFRDSMSNVAIIHVPYKKSLIESALSDPDFKVQTMTKAGNYYRLMPER